MGTHVEVREQLDKLDTGAVFFLVLVPTVQSVGLSGFVAYTLPAEASHLLSMLL